MERREFVAAVAALAATRLKDEGGADDGDHQEAMENGLYTTGSFTPTGMWTSGEGTVASWLVEPESLDEMELEVSYDATGILLSIEGRGDDVRGGVLGEFDRETAREAAAALYQAAEEHRHRMEDTTERAGRAQDKEDLMERLRDLGYM